MITLEGQDWIFDTRFKVIDGGIFAMGVNGDNDNYIISYFKNGERKTICECSRPIYNLITVDYNQNKLYLVNYELNTQDNTTYLLTLYAINTDGTYSSYRLTN
jgi:hypothetical protein